MSILRDPRASANLLLLEVGNSHIALATSRDGRLGDPHRVNGVELTDLSARLDTSWQDLPDTRLRAVLIASVVPAATSRLREAIGGRLGAEPLLLGEDVPVPIVANVSKPKSVGIDRLCAAAAAFAEIQGACVVASFGTATTIDCVDDEGAFRGGAILPGLATQSWALHARTAQLPEVEIAAPTGVYGGDTRDAILNGIVYGAVGALREIVERYATDLGRWPRLVVTGGFGPLVRESCEFVDALVPDLVLRGMVHAYRTHYANEDNADLPE